MIKELSGVFYKATNPIYVGSPLMTQLSPQNSTSKYHYFVD